MIPLKTPFPWPMQTPAAMNSYYGNPDVNGDGLPDSGWEALNIVPITPPYPMKWSWGGVCRTLKVHRLVAASLTDILKEIGQEFTAADRARFQLDQCGGGYNFRVMRGSSRRLSIHSWGAAIDLAPLLNPLGRAYDPARLMMPQKAVAIFQKRGWTWGGDWDHDGDTRDQNTLDSMHFQAAFV